MAATPSLGPGRQRHADARQHLQAAKHLPAACWRSLQPQPGAMRHPLHHARCAGLIIDYASMEHKQAEFRAATLKLLATALFCGVFSGIRGGLFTVTSE